jgi:hypothetical protein
LDLVSDSYFSGRQQRLHHNKGIFGGLIWLLIAAMLQLVQVLPVTAKAKNDQEADTVKIRFGFQN